MTKKDYLRLAQALKDSKPINSRDLPVAMIAWENSVLTITLTLANDNPRFDRKRFLNACGYTGDNTVSLIKFVLAILKLQLDRFTFTHDLSDQRVKFIQQIRNRK